MKLRNKKTGEITETHLLVVQSVEDPTKRYYAGSIKDLCDNYEDYKPAEPLIKDEKIRKAVRAWAEAVGEEETFIVSYNIEYRDCCIYTGNLSNTATIDLGTDLNIKEGSYAIAELCGEGEE